MSLVPPIIEVASTNDTTNIEHLVVGVWGEEQLTIAFSRGAQSAGVMVTTLVHAGFTQVFNFCTQCDCRFT